MVMFKIKSGCPLCRYDLKGNERFKFFCSHCDLLFDRKDIHYAPEETKKLDRTEEKEVLQKFDLLDKQKGVKLEEQKEEDILESLPDVTEDASDKVEIKEDSKDYGLIGSDQSGKVHVKSCHFVKKIQEDRRRYFRSADEAIAQEYEPCVCLRKLLLQQRG